MTEYDFNPEHQSDLELVDPEAAKRFQQRRQQRRKAKEAKAEESKAQAPPPVKKSA